MKIFNISLFFIILFLLNICLIAQNLEPYKILPFSVGNEIDSLNYFPYAVGNTWQYVYDDGKFEQVKIVQHLSDSIGNTYLNIHTITEPWWKYKISTNEDSVFLYPFSLNKLVYKFPSDSGEIFKQDTTDYSWAKVYDTYDVIIFGDTTHAIEIRYYGHHPDTFPTMFNYTEVLAANYGLIYYGDEVEYKFLVGCVINGDTSGIIFTDVQDDEPSILPSGIELYQNYPNPFNSTTTITYYLSKTEKIKLVVYNIIGEEILTLADGEFPKGNYKISIQTNSLSSGTYFYSLIINNKRVTKKMILLK